MQWEEEPYCKKLLEALCTPHADQYDLCQVLRTPGTKPEGYRPTVQGLLRAVGNIARAWYLQFHFWYENGNLTF